VSIVSVTQQAMQRDYSLGQSTENARRPHEFRRYDGTTSWWPAAERRWRLCAISETGTQSAARYRGAVNRWGSDEWRWWLYTWRAIIHYTRPTFGRNRLHDWSVRQWENRLCLLWTYI